MELMPERLKREGCALEIVSGPKGGAPSEFSGLKNDEINKSGSLGGPFFDLRGRFTARHNFQGTTKRE